MIKLPKKCQRKYPYCKPLAQELSDGHGFICLGYHGGTMVDNDPPDDIYCHCFKGGSLDEETCFDKRDITSLSANMAQGLNVIENIINNKDKRFKKIIGKRPK